MQINTIPDTKSKKALQKLIQKHFPNISEKDGYELLFDLRRVVNLFAKLREPQIQFKIIEKIIDGEKTKTRHYALDLVEQITLDKHEEHPTK